MKLLQRSSYVTLAALAAATALGSSALAAAAARPIPLSAERDLGRLAPQTLVRLTVGFKVRDAAGLDALLAAQKNPGSPFFRHFLRPAQVRDAFGASSADYARTANALRRAGFTVVRLDPLRTIVDVEASAATVERYFGTTLHALGTARGAGYANVTAARIPAELRSTVGGIVGLKNTRTFETAYQAKYGIGKKPVGAPHATPAPSPTPTVAPTPVPTPTPIPTPTGATPLFGPDRGYGPRAIEGAFDFPIRHGYFGNGATVADLIDGEFSDAMDLAPYLAEFRVYRNGPATTIRLVDGGCGGEINCFDSFQAAINAEGIVGTAPGVQLIDYEISGLSNRGIIDGLNAIVSDDVADVANFSFAGCETALGEASYLLDEGFKLGSAEGITFDTITFNGSNPCGTPNSTSAQAPSDSPNAIAVGGADTFVDDYGNVINRPIGDGASGGGFSLLFGLPNFQHGVKNVIPAGRNLPDVSGPDAIDTTGPSIYFSLAGGWAGGFAFIDNAPVAAALAESAQIRGARLGTIDDQYYALFKKDGYKTIFTDVTLGCNGGAGSGPFCALPGYDQVSGIGVPDFYNLAKRL